MVGLSFFYILIAHGGTFATSTVNTHANMFFVFLPGGISKEWRHIVQQSVTLRGIYLANIECSRVFRGTPGETKNSSRES